MAELRVAARGATSRAQVKVLSFNRLLRFLPGQCLTLGSFVFGTPDLAFNLQGSLVADPFCACVLPNRIDQFKRGPALWSGSKTSDRAVSGEFSIHPKLKPPARLTSRHQISYALMMRTTLSLDDDVAATLERLRRSRRISLKRLVNEALRRGLDDMGRRRKPREAVRTRAVALGRVRIAGIDNIGEALAIAEGESFK
jgi:hypothetical protein